MVCQRLKSTHSPPCVNNLSQNTRRKSVIKPLNSMPKINSFYCLEKGDMFLLLHFSARLHVNFADI